MEMKHEHTHHADASLTTIDKKLAIMMVLSFCTI